MIGALFGILAAFSWGGGDFVGGIASRRLPTLIVVLTSQAATLALLLPAAIVSGQAIPEAAALGRTALAGLAGGLGVLSLYHGFAHGRISIVASIAGTLAALIPVAVSIAGGEAPSALRIVGFIGAITAIVIVSTSGDSPEQAAAHSATHADRSSGVAMAGGAAYGLAAGLGFAMFSLIFSGVPASGTLWLLATLRVASVSALSLIVVVALLTRRQPPGFEPIRAGAIPRDRLGRLRLALILLTAGSGDSLGNLFFFLAAGVAGVGVAAVYTSIAPVTTVLFAAVILGERVGRRQGIGVALAGAATVAIAVGGVV
jgi:drug/metabolite transporter (DMT)-like permease